MVSRKIRVVSKFSVEILTTGLTVYGELHIHICTHTYIYMHACMQVCSILPETNMLLSQSYISAYKNMNVNSLRVILIEKSNVYEARQEHIILECTLTIHSSFEVRILGIPEKLR